MFLSCHYEKYKFATVIELFLVEEEICPGA